MLVCYCFFRQIGPEIRQHSRFVVSELVVGSCQQDKRIHKPARGLLRFAIPDGGSGGAGQNVAERVQKKS